MILSKFIIFFRDGVGFVKPKNVRFSATRNAPKKSFNEMNEKKKFCEKSVCVKNIGLYVNYLPFKNDNKVCYV